MRKDETNEIIPILIVNELSCSPFKTLDKIKYHPENKKSFIRIMAGIKNLDGLTPYDLLCKRIKE